VLEVDSFFNDNNKYLYAIMVGIFKKKVGSSFTFDISFLQSMARERGVEDNFIARSGGKSYLEFLTLTKDSLVDCSSFGNYVDRIISLHTKRKLLISLNDASNKVLSSKDSPDELMVSAQEGINTLLNSSKKVDYVNIGSLASSYIETSLKEKKTVLGIPTMFKTLDSVLHGLKRKSLTIIMAPRKTGKSTFLMNVALNVSVCQGLPVLMVSTETPDEEMLSRVMSNLSDVDEYKIASGNLSSAELNSVRSAEVKIKSSNFYNIYIPVFSIEKVVSIIRKFVDKVVGYDQNGKVKDCLIVFDYIKMPQSDLGKSAEMKEYKVLGLITDCLKGLAGELDVPVFAACQTNRGGDVASSYEITWFCNTFMELKKKSESEIEKEKEMGNYSGNQRLKITANRGGAECGGIDFEFYGNILKYQEIGFSRKAKND
jgi:replicative DNA helicase